MTSKHSFFKYMREDLRHKIWMLALSALGNFLAIPVAYLIMVRSYNYTTSEVHALIGYAESYIGYNISFFGEYLTVAGGIIAYVGAVLVGLFGFRYLFKKKMVDTYHSMPIKRNKLFLVNYINGILVWLLPLLGCLLITTLLSIINMNRHAAVALNIQVIGQLFKQMGISLGTLLVSYLLVYHLVLIAVMISGNILNTLVSTCILGGGAVSVYLLGYAFLEMYMDTFYGTGAGAEVAMYVSPLVSAGYVLYMRILGEGFGTVLSINVLITLLLGVLAWYLYLKRASELAEQGIKNKVATFIMKLVTGVAAGMGGWLFFVMITQYDSYGWGIFGAVLVSVVVFGVLDMIFHMDFKAFVASKFTMAGCTVLTVLICLAFSLDWLGYDAYVPDAEDVKSLAFYSTDYSNRAYYYGEEDWPLDSMQIQDKQAIVAFLTAGVNNVNYVPYVESYNSLSDAYYYDTDYRDIMVVKVTLENGREYYRSYGYLRKDKEVVWPLITDPEYVESVYMIDEERLSEMNSVTIRNACRYLADELEDKKLIERLVVAYNRDLTENPEETIAGEGRLLGEIRIFADNYNHRRTIDVYEGMKHTMAALQATGYGELRALEPDEVNSIHISMDYYHREEELQNVDVEQYVREQFGLYIETEESEKENMDSADDKKESVIVEVTEQAAAWEGGSYAVQIKATITDQVMIRELLSLLHYDAPNRGPAVFGKSMKGSIIIEDTNGNHWDVYIRSGELPEKYLKLFELEIAEEQ